MSENPWAHIDNLKAKHAAEIAAAVSELTRAGFSGDVAGRLEWDGTHWRFPVSSVVRKARTLGGLLAICLPLAPHAKRGAA